jgi:peptidoglycan hydrolase-like protein with peptidoglycan-binding domain
MPTLRMGSQDAVAVKLLQAALNKAKANPQLLEDGDFGPATRTAVRDFQLAYGLSPDGVCGHDTWAKLEQVVTG